MAGIKTPEDFAEVIGQAKLTELREVIAPPGKRSMWLKVLNDHQLAEVYFRLQNGENPHSVTCMIQKEWQIRSKSDPRSLARTVRNFFKKTVGEIRQEVFDAGGDSKEAKYAETRVSVVAKKIDAIQEYIWMIQMQKNRIKAYMASEGAAKIPYEATDKAMKNLKEMLDGYALLCIKLGILDAVPPELNIRMKQQFEHIMKVTVQDDKPKLIRAVDRFVEQLDDACISLKKDDAGETYHMQELPYE